MSDVYVIHEADQSHENKIYQLPPQVVDKETGSSGGGFTNYTTTCGVALLSSFHLLLIILT